MNEADQRTQRIENMIDITFQLVFTLEVMAFEFMLHHSIRGENSEGIQKPKNPKTISRQMFCPTG